MWVRVTCWLNVNVVGLVGPLENEGLVALAAEGDARLLDPPVRDPEPVEPLQASPSPAHEESG